MRHRDMTSEGVSPTMDAWSAMNCVTHTLAIVSILTCSSRVYFSLIWRTQFQTPPNLVESIYNNSSYF